MSLLIVIGATVGILVLLAFLPSILGAALDPINKRRIKTKCIEYGCSNIEVEAFPNHYGVRFEKNGVQKYAKCRVIGRSIKWKGKNPNEL